MTIDTNNFLKTVAEKAMEGAKKRGVDGVRVVTSKDREVSVTYRNGVPDKVTEATQRSLGLRLYMGGRYTTCTTNDLREDALEKFLDSSVALCKAMTPDAFRALPDPSLYQGRQSLDLQLFDPAVAIVRPEERSEYAGSLEAAVRKEAGEKTVTAEASLSDSENEFYQIHSNGFEGSSRQSSFWSSAELTIKDEGDKRPNGWSEAGSRFRSTLLSPADVAKVTAANALARIGSTKIATSKMTMLVENRTVGSVLRHLMAAVSGKALQQKASFLDGFQGKKFGSKLLDITDDPFVVSGFGSRLFDSEGISAKRLPLFEKGIFRNFLIDTYYGKKLGMAPTTGGSSNLVITPGKKSLEALIAGIDKGIFVRGFVGGNSNSTTGDFSLGVYGTLIEKGKLTRAVSEMNIAGNHKEFWNRLVAVGNDLYPFSTLRSPSIVFDDIQFAGA